MTNKATYWSELLPFLLSRGVDEAVGSVFFRNAPLNRWLRRKLSDSVLENNAKTATSSSLLGDPLFEATFPWKKSGKSIPELVRDGILSEETKINLSLKPPYTHQLQAYRLLLAKDRCNSIIVSSGTGSGKTECFMVPIIEDLVREKKSDKLRRKGIRAIFLYPLNALINNQRDRLFSFTHPFNGEIQYCLYTSELEDLKSSVGSAYEKLHPEEIFTRRAMREKVPHLLITNSSMLERMLLRAEDQPMIQATKRNQTFRWIVLDEAHTYIGTRAAELALLLRRVLNAFNVDANDVHFVATSATIDAADDKAKQKLRQFLSDLSGSPLENIHLILGDRSIPSPIETEGLRDDESLEELQKLACKESSAKLAEHLKLSRTAMRIRNEFIRPPHYLTLTALQERIGIDSAKETLKWIDLLTMPEGNSALLPLRLQQMMSTTNVLNVCPDPNCPAREEELVDPEWHFGQVYLDGRQTCSCGAPLFPLAACSHCSAVALKADLLITHEGDELFVRPGDESAAAKGWTNFESEGAPDLEQSVTVDIEAEENKEVDTSSAPNDAPQAAFYPECNDCFDKGLESESTTCLEYSVLITNEKYSADKNCTASLSWVKDGIEKKAQIVFREALPENDFRITCPSCGEGLPPERYYLRKISGQYVNSLIPLLLDYCSIPKQNVSRDCPMDGRRLLSFTDSRQGTAKTAALIEREGERSFVASRVFNMLAPEQIPDDVQKELAKFEVLLKQIPPSNQYLIEKIIKEKREEYLGKIKKWQDVSEAISQELKKYEKGRLKNLIKSLQTDKTECTNEEAAEILLLREFCFRPVNGVNLETCGLIKVTYPDLANANPPARLENLFSREKWQSYLKLVIDFFVRTQHAVEIPNNWRYLSGNSKVFAKTILKPGSENNPSKRQVRWPSAQPGAKRSARIVRLTAKILGIDLDTASKDKCASINDVLEAAFKALTEVRILRPGIDPGSGFHMDFRESAALERNEIAWHFDGTNQLFDTIVGDPKTACCPLDPDIVGAYPVNLPSPPAVDFEMNVLKARNDIRSFLSKSQDYLKLIESGAWNRYGTYALEQDGYFAAAEHTAQLMKNARRSNEKDFSDGFINVLASSTTMEMGIDLGDIGAVVLHGVPPHPANYLQRIGRAGRRDETRSNAFTICRSRNRDREVFVKPSWALEAPQPALNISLHSHIIVERHVAAEVLSAFIMSNTQAKESLKLQTWLGSKQKEFSDWLIEELKKINRPSELGKRLRQIVRCSCLESMGSADLVAHAKEMIEKASSHAQTLLERYGRRIAEARLNKNEDAYIKSLSYQRERLANRELLEYLTEELVLPSSIRVVNTVAFDPGIPDEKIEGAEKSENHKTKFPNHPSREGRTGIFEYAPGASIIIAGTQYVSGGIKMDWTTPNSQESARKIQSIKNLFICPDCHRRFLVPISESSARCPDCGTEISQPDG